MPLDDLEQISICFQADAPETVMIKLDAVKNLLATIKKSKPKKEDIVE